MIGCPITDLQIQEDKHVYSPNRAICQNKHEKNHAHGN